MQIFCFALNLSTSLPEWTPSTLRTVVDWPDDHMNVVCHCRLLPLREDYTSYWKFNGANIFILLLVIWKATVASVKSCRYAVLSCRAQLKSSYGWKLWPDLSLKKPKHRVISAYVWKVGSVNYLQKPAVTNYDQIDKVTHWWALLEFKG